MTRIAVHRRHLKNENENEKGAATVLVAFSAATLITFVAVCVDVGLVLNERHEMHDGTDAAVLAAALMLDNGVVDPVALADEAQKYALANGITLTELDNGNFVEVGEWTEPVAPNPSYPYGVPGSFTSWPTAPLINAVRVRARREVSLRFGGLLNINSMNPIVESIAYSSTAGKTNCAIPYGVEGPAIQNLNYGDIINVDMAAGGNWGKLDIGGNMSSQPNFIAAMIGTTCVPEVAVGDPISPGTGFAGVPKGFEDRLNLDPIVIIPVVTAFGDGNHDVTTIGFILGELIAQSGHNGGGNSNNGGGGSHGGGSGNGAKWTGEIRLLNEFSGSSGGGPTNGPFMLSRSLVR